MSTAVFDFDTRTTTPSRRVPAQRTAAVRMAPSRVPHPAGTSVPRPTLRLTRRGRVVVLLVTVGAAFGAFTVLSDPAVSTPEHHRSSAEKVIVEPGQSLWDIATEIAPGEDTRDVISEIVDLNALESAGSIQAGQALFVPRY